MLGLQSGVMLMPSDPATQPKLPQHDFASKELYITPSAHRFIEKEGTGVFVDGIISIISFQKKLIISSCFHLKDRYLLC